MLWGLAGASGTGKTTLGEAAAKAMNVAFVKTSITGMAAKHGFNAVSDLPLSRRLVLQEHLLDEMTQLIDTCDRPVILDRTPLDLIGYLLGEVHMHAHEDLAGREMRQVEDYIRRCQRLTSRMFDHIFITSPLPTYEEAETRPSWNPAYQAHVHLLISGAVFASPFNLRYTLFRTPDFDKRLEVTTEVLRLRMDQLEQFRKTARHIH